MNRSKRYKELTSKYEKEKRYSLQEGIHQLLGLTNANFDETIELSVELGVDAKKSDQMVRGSVSLPNGSGRERKVLALAKGELQIQAEEGGADWVGSDEYIKKIEDGWLEFDAIVVVPEMMPNVAKLGRILGPRGLMPTPKNGTVSRDIKRAVEEIKKGKVSFKIDKGGNLHIPIGKASFKEEDLYENLREVLKKIWNIRPISVSSGVYFRNIVLSSTMSPGVKIDIQQVRNAFI